MEKVLAKPLVVAFGFNHWFAMIKIVLRSLGFFIAPEVSPFRNYILNVAYLTLSSPLKKSIATSGSFNFALPCSWYDLRVKLNHSL